MMNSRNNGTTMAGSTNNNNTDNDIVQKLHGVLAKLRRDVDTVHRQKELSMERLRLVQEERSSVEKTVQSYQQKLEGLTTKATEEATKDIEQLEQDVQKLTQEDQFQHTELLGKKDKITKLQNYINTQVQERKISYDVARETLRKQREKIATMTMSSTLSLSSDTTIHNNGEMPQDTTTANIDVTNTASSTTVTSRRTAGQQPQEQGQQQQKEKIMMDKLQRLLQREMEHDSGEEMWLKWPRVIEQKANMVTTEANELQRLCERLERRIDKYKMHLLLEVGESEEDTEMTPPSIVMMNTATTSNNHHHGHDNNHTDNHSHADHHNEEASHLMSSSTTAMTMGMDVSSHHEGQLHERGTPMDLQ